MPCFFFFNDTATTEIYTLSLHDALPISRRGAIRQPQCAVCGEPASGEPAREAELLPRSDRKSTRLNSSHLVISYAVFCLKKKTRHSEWPVALTAYESEQPRLASAGHTSK